MSEYPIPPADELFGWCSSCDKLVMTSQLDLEQVEAAEGAECPTCGDYLITKENEEMEKLIERIARLESENTRLLNDASIWRNRAISAEEELAGTNQLRPRKARAALAKKGI